jgi:hypothetical protein
MKYAWIFLFKNIYTLISLVRGGNSSTSTKISSFTDEKISDTDTINNELPRLRVNSSPTRFSSLKNAFLQNGISVKMKPSFLC